MRVHIFLLSLLLSTISLSCATEKTFEVVGTGECGDCKAYNIETTQAFTGLGVTIDCKLKNGDLKRIGAGNLDKEGKFKVAIPNGDELLKEECYAQLHSDTLGPCPTHNGLEASKIALKAQSNGQHTFGLSKNLEFSSELCSSKFLWPHFKHHPLIEKIHAWKKKFPIYNPKFSHPPIYTPKSKPPVYKPEPKPKPEPPVYKPKPEPPVYKPKPKPEPPVYKPKPKPEPPVYKPKPEPPVYKPKPEPPVYKPKPKPETPVYKPKPKPETPVYKPKPIPTYKPPTIVKPLHPIFKKPLLPPPIPHYPLPPFYKKKPLPPLPKLKIPPKYFKHPKFGHFPPLPPLPPSYPHP